MLTVYLNTGSIFQILTVYLAGGGLAVRGERQAPKGGRNQGPTNILTVYLNLLTCWNILTYLNILTVYLNILTKTNAAAGDGLAGRGERQAPKVRGYRNIQTVSL